MNILILGGTIFVGRHLAAAAVAREHSVSIFHRGRTAPEGIPGTESVIGDREGDLRELGDRRFDVVFDTSGYLPRLVRASAESLRERVEQYVFVSSLSVYADRTRLGLDENSPVAEPPEPAVEVIDGTTYGGLKVACERAIAELIPDRHLIVRPGVLIGPHDPTDRFTYWVARATREGPILAPPRATAVECTDARDLAEWLVECAETRRTGTYNVSGPTERKTTFGEILDICCEVAGTSPDRVHRSEESLIAGGVRPGKDLPLWMGPGIGFLAGADSTRALSNGLRFRPLRETVADTLAWVRRRPADQPFATGLDPEREREHLEARP